MKNLEEVIKAVHHCGLLSGFDDTYEYDGGCPYEDCSKCEQKRMLGKDIIQYLAAYKDDKNELTALRAFWKEQHDNHPLDWDELKKMSGKPVWVEWIDAPWKGISKWVLIDRVSELMAIFTAIDACGVNYNGNLHNLSMGTQWNAYRKERK